MILLSNNKKLQKTLINVCELNVYLFREFKDTHIDRLESGGILHVPLPAVGIQ